MSESVSKIDIVVIFCYDLLLFLDESKCGSAHPQVIEPATASQKTQKRRRLRQSRRRMKRRCRGDM